MAERVIVNGAVVTAQGVIEGGSVVVRDGLIDGVVSRHVTAGSAEIIDATGCVVLPGIVNSHTHGCTTGPLFSSGAPAVSPEVAQSNLDRHLAGGVTTLVNTCGFGLPSEIPDHPIDVLLSTNHLPHAFIAADLVDGAGLRPEHRAASVEGLVNAGARLIGETGSGATLGGGVAAYRYMPGVLRSELDWELSPEEATRLIDALVGTSRREDPDDQRLARELERQGMPGGALRVVRDAVMTAVVAPVQASLDSFREAVQAAEATGLPAMFHAAGPSVQTLSELARDTSAHLVAGHLNHTSIPEEDLIALARTLRSRGVTIDVASLDMIHAQRLTDPKRADLLVAHNLVDTLSTDYAGGAWEPMLAVANHWLRRGYVDLLDVARLCAQRPAEILRLQDRGRIEPGLRADITIVAPGNLEEVRAVLIAGHRVLGTS